MIKILKGTVIKGKQLGRKIGFPTANILYKKNDIEDASYKINIVLDGIVYNGAGVFRSNIDLFEAHIFNFDKEIYGKQIEVVIIEEIRKNKKINSLEELKVLIEDDVEKIKKLKYSVLTFGTFDLVHKGHINFLNQAKKYGDKLITIIATDKNVEILKGKKTKYNIKKRISDLKKTGISDEVIAGDEENPLKCLNIYSPKVICLGYDQIGFSNDLKAYIQDNKLDIVIIRLDAYKENIYKSSLLKEK